MKRLYTKLLSALLLMSVTTQAQYSIVPSASLKSSSPTQNCFVLNAPGMHTKGAVWSQNTISLANSFSISTTMYFGSGAYPGQADGIAFVLQSTGNSAIGLSGGGIGYEGITPSFVVEFDMFQNNQDFTSYDNDDMAADHIGFMKNGDPNHTTGALAAAVAIPYEVENGQFHPVTFSWNATTKVFTVTAFGLIYTYSGDIVAQIFSNNPNVFWGLTGATGSVDNVQYEVCINTPTTPPPPPPPPPAVCGQLRTQTPGGWGSKPSGNNPGKYLHTNFAAAFPMGVTIGVMNGKYYKFTNAQAITNFLPSGGTPAKIPSSATNPTNIKNTFAGHLLALSLSVGFDDYDPNFASGGVKIGDMIINFGPFNGWTVRDFLAEANKVIGGTSNAYTVQQVHTTASAINEAYVDGKGSSNVLKCPTVDAGPRLAPDRDGIYVTDEKPHSLRTYPNPTTGMFQVQFETQSHGRVQIEITGSNGNIVERRSANVNRGQNMRFDLSRQPAGIYLIRIITEEGVSTQKVIVQK